MFRLLGKFARLRAGQQRLLVRIWIMLAGARLLLLWKGLSYFTGSLTQGDVSPVIRRVTDSQAAQARELGWLVSVAARYTPWKSPCLSQVLVLQQLLARRNIPGCLCLGVRRGCDDTTALDAHAWLQCGDDIVNGASVGEPYTALSTYSWC